MASEIRSELAERLQSEIANLEQQKKEIEGAIGTLRSSIRELAGRASGEAHLTKGAKSKAARKEEQVLVLLAEHGGKATGKQLAHRLRMNSGTITGVVERLMKVNFVRRLDFKVDRSWVYEITEKGEQAANGRVTEEKEVAAIVEREREREQPKAEPKAEPKPKPKPKPKAKSSRDNRPTEEKYAGVDAALRKNGGEMKFDELVRAAGVNGNWMRQHLPELMERRIVAIRRYPDKTVPVGYRVTYMSPLVMRETRVHVGEGVEPGRRLPE